MYILDCIICFDYDCFKKIISKFVFARLDGNIT